MRGDWCRCGNGDVVSNGDRCGAEGKRGQGDGNGGVPSVVASGYSALRCSDRTGNQREIGR